MAVTSNRSSISGVIGADRGGAVSALQIFASDLIYILQQYNDWIYILQQTDKFCVDNLHLIKDSLYQFNLVTFTFLTLGKAQGEDSASALHIIASSSQTSYLIDSFAAKLPNLHLRNTIYLLGEIICSFNLKFKWVY